MLIPLFTYCSIVTCRTSITYKQKVESLGNRPYEIFFRNQPSNKRLPSIEHLMNKKFCLNGDSRDNFNDYFEIMNNKTRNNEILTRLPLKSDSNPAKRVSFITKENASMISQLKLEVLKIIKSS